MDEAYARFSRLLIDRPHPRVLRVVMNRPDKLNATDGEMHSNLTEIWRVIDADPSVSAVLLTGAGKAFSAAGDPAWLTEWLPGAAPPIAVWKKGATWSKTLSNSTKPVARRSTARRWARGWRWPSSPTSPSPPHPRASSTAIPSSASPPAITRQSSGRCCAAWPRPNTICCCASRSPARRPRASASFRLRCPTGSCRPAPWTWPCAWPRARRQRYAGPSTRSTIGCARRGRSSMPRSAWNSSASADTKRRKVRRLCAKSARRDFRAMRCDPRRGKRCSMHHGPAVDGDRLSRDQLTRIGYEPMHGAEQIRRRQISRDRLARPDGIERLVRFLGEEFARSLGQHRARCDGIDANVVAAELAGKTASEPDHGSLGRGVVQAVRHPVGGRERGHVDDAAAAGLSQGRHHGLAAVPDAFDVHRHRSVPIRFGDRVESAACEAAVKRGIVDEGIDASERVERGARHLHRRRRARDVELGADRGALFAPHELERLRAVVDVREHDTRAEAAEIAGVFLPDPARGTRDHDDLSFDLHGDITASA